MALFGVALAKRFSIILAALDEDRNVKVMLEKIGGLFQKGRLPGLCEILVINGNKSEKTMRIVDAASRKSKGYKIRLLFQKVSPGLVPAQLEGVKRAGSDILVIMDCDLQHPPEDISRLIAEKERGYDLAVASRRLGYEGDKRAFSRTVISKVARRLAYAYVKRSRKLADPLSGFFAVDRKYLAGLEERPNLYKLLLYLIAANPGITVSEIDFRFRQRLYGSSKIISASLRFIRNYMSELRYYREIERRG